MSLASKIIGETTMTTAVAPVMVAPPTVAKPAQKRLILKRKKKSLTDSILGIHEDRDGSIIPANAKLVSDRELADQGLDYEYAEEEEKCPEAPANGVMDITSALVAPDVQPTGIKTIDFTSAPGFKAGAKPGDANDGVIDTVLAKNAAPKTTQAPETPAKPLTDAEAAQRVNDLKVDTSYTSGGDIGESLMRAPQAPPHTATGAEIKNVMKGFLPFLK